LPFVMNLAWSGFRQNNPPLLARAAGNKFARTPFLYYQSNSPFA
jgi:hypothetical protein